VGMDKRYSCLLKVGTIYRVKKINVQQLLDCQKEKSIEVYDDPNEPLYHNIGYNEDHFVLIDELSHQMRKYLSLILGINIFS
jgi:hypothetical protein